MLSINSIINKNIINGDALSLIDLNTKKSIIFSEWSLINNKVKRRDFTFENLLDSSFDSRGTLFEQIDGDVFIPEPIKDFALVDYDKVYEIYLNSYNPDVLTMIANLSNDRVITPPKIAKNFKYTS